MRSSAGSGSRAGSSASPAKRRNAHAPASGVSTACASSSSATAGNDDDLPAALPEHVACEIVLVQALHDDHDRPLLLVVEPRIERRIEPVVGGGAESRVTHASACGPAAGCQSRRIRKTCKRHRNPPRKQSALDMVPAGFHGVERIVGHACYCESGGNRSPPPAVQAVAFAGIIGRVRLARAAAMREQAYAQGSTPRLRQVSMTLRPAA